MTISAALVSHHDINHSALLIRKTDMMKYYGGKQTNLISSERILDRRQLSFRWFFRLPPTNTIEDSPSFFLLRPRPRLYVSRQWVSSSFIRKYHVGDFRLSSVLPSSSVAGTTQREKPQRFRKPAKQKRSAKTTNAPISSYVSIVITVPPSRYLSTE